MIILDFRPAAGATRAGGDTLATAFDGEGSQATGRSL
jgi:hypothetical protein